MNDLKNTTRRDFLRTCVTGAVVLGAGDALALTEAASTAVRGNNSSKSSIVLARDPMLRTSDGTVDPKRIATLLDKAMARYFGTKRPLDPWKKIVKPGEVIGLKVNTIAGPALSSNVAMVDAICERLQQAGIRPGDIIIWDRTNRELQRAGFKLNSDPSRIRCMGTEKEHEDQAESFGQVSCRVSRIMTRMCHGIINVPLLKHHSMSGVTAAMKNMYGVIHNPQACHGNGCNPYIADVNMLPAIRQKLRFTICDVTTSVYEGGPSYNPQYAYKFNGIMVGHDAVALDYCGWQIIEHMRTEKGLKPLQQVGKTPQYIATAADAQHQLGTNDPHRISLIEV